MLFTKQLIVINLPLLQLLLLQIYYWPPREISARKMTSADDTEADYEVVVNNVACTVNLGCQVNLQKLAEDAYNVELRNGKVTIRLRKPKVTGYVWSKGTLMCVGARSEAEARVGTRRIARIVQKKGFEVKLREMSIVNVMACCTFPFRIRIHNFASHYRETSYEPELSSAAVYQIPELKARLQLYATGNIIILAPNVENVNKAAKHIQPMAEKFRRDLTVAEKVARAEKRMQAQKRLLFR